MVATLAGMSSADTVKSVRLQADFFPYRFDHPVSGDRYGVKVKSSGEVVSYRNSEPEKKVDQLTPKEMEILEDKIKKASLGALKFIPDFCQAIPTTQYHYSANGDQVKLLSGASPCGGNLERQSSAAKELVKTLQEYLYQ